MPRHELGEQLAMPMTGRPNCSSRMPLARQRLLAPAIRRPVVVTALLSVCFIFPFSFQSPAGSGPVIKTLSPVGERLYFQSTIRITFLPLSPKDDEQQGNDVNIRMIQGVHSRFSVFVRFLRQSSACRPGLPVMPDAFCLTMAKI